MKLLTRTKAEPAAPALKYPGNRTATGGPPGADGISQAWSVSMRSWRIGLE